MKKKLLTTVQDWRKQKLREMEAKDKGVYARIKYQLLLQAEIDELTTARDLYHKRADDILCETELASRYYYKVKGDLDKVIKDMEEFSKRMKEKNECLQPDAAVKLAAKCRLLDARWAQLRRFYEEHIGGEHEDLAKHGLQEDLEKRGFPTLKEIYKRLAELKQEMANIDDQTWFENLFDKAIKEGRDRIVSDMAGLTDAEGGTGSTANQDDPVFGKDIDDESRVRTAQVTELVTDFLLNLADGIVSGLAGLTDAKLLTILASCAQYVVTGASSASNLLESAGKAKTICNKDVELYHKDSATLLEGMTGLVSDLKTRYHKWRMEKGSKESKETWVRRIHEEIEQEEAKLDKLRDRKSAVGEILSAYKSHAGQQLSAAKERIVPAMQRIREQKHANARELIEISEAKLEAAVKAWAEISPIVAQELEKGDEFLKPQEDKIEELRKLLSDAENDASG